MHTCTCNDDNNILTHEFEVDQSIDITPKFDCEATKKTLHQNDSQVIFFSNTTLSFWK